MLDHGLKIALLHQSEIAAPVPLPPAGRLLLTRDGGLQRDARTAAPQLQHGLAEVEVTPPGHTTDEMSVPTIVYLRQFPLQPPFQRQTTGVGLILPPWKFVRPVAGKTAALLSLHIIPPGAPRPCFVSFILVYPSWQVNVYRTFVFQKYKKGGCIFAGPMYNKGRENN